MGEESYKNLCIFHDAEGLRSGLSSFSHPSRIALIYAFTRSTPLRVYDPQDLLRDHEPKIKELFVDSREWKGKHLHSPGEHCSLIETTSLDLAGLIAYGGRSSAIFYQMWFTEHHPDICSTGPIKRWLEHAALLLCQDIALANDINIGTSGYVLQGYGLHAVRDYLVDQRNMLLGPDSRLRIYPVLEAVLGISRTREEGAWARGSLVFIEPELIPGMDLLVTFSADNRPDMKNFKHVRKYLLAAEDSRRRLVSDGISIVGLTEAPVPPSSITADFHGNFGYLYLADECVCSFFEGSFHATTRKAKMVQLEEALLEFSFEQDLRHRIFRTIMCIVHQAQERKWGCALILDLNPEPLGIIGQTMTTPLDMSDEKMLELAVSLAKMDGALHIDRHLRLLGFGCLMDGHRVNWEDSSRGARYNSALRFTAENENIIVVVVSSDRPVSIIRGGIDVQANCEWAPVYEGFRPPTLEAWLEGA